MPLLPWVGVGIGLLCGIALVLSRRNLGQEIDEGLGIGGREVYRMRGANVTQIPSEGILMVLYVLK